MARRSSRRHLTPQRAAEIIASNFANGDVPRETSDWATLDQLGVSRPGRRRRRDDKALTEEIITAYEQGPRQ